MMMIFIGSGLRRKTNKLNKRRKRLKGVKCGGACAKREVGEAAKNKKLKGIRYDTGGCTPPPHPPPRWRGQTFRGPSLIVFRRLSQYSKNAAFRSPVAAS